MVQYQKSLKKLKKRVLKGFTLLEMLIVLIIVALLMAIIIPNVSGQKERIEAQARQNIAEIVETQVHTYEMVEQSQSATLSDLVAKGYLTQKQAQEAERLLYLGSDTVISVPINIPE